MDPVYQANGEKPKKGLRKWFLNSVKKCSKIKA